MSQNNAGVVSQVCEIKMDTCIWPVDQSVSRAVSRTVGSVVADRGDGGGGQVGGGCSGCGRRMVAVRASLLTEIKEI